MRLPERWDTAPGAVGFRCAGVLRRGVPRRVRAVFRVLGFRAAVCFG